MGQAGNDATLYIVPYNCTTERRDGASRSTNQRLRIRTMLAINLLCGIKVSPQNWCSSGVRRPTLWGVLRRRGEKRAQIARRTGGSNCLKYQPTSRSVAGGQYKYRKHPSRSSPRLLRSTTDSTRFTTSVLPKDNGRLVQNLASPTRSVGGHRSIGQSVQL